MFHSLSVLGKKECKWESTEEWGIGKLPVVCLVALPTGAVSYTPLTLTTSELVRSTVVAQSTRKNNDKTRSGA